MADDCDLESVKDFILSKGGKIRNADLVTRYRRFLDNPQNKGSNREKFKDIVNTLATIKKDDSGEKILVLKKKYRGGPPGETHSATPVESSRAQSEPPKPPGALEGPGVSRVKSEGQLESSSGSSGSMETVSASSVSTADSSMSAEEEDKSDQANMSVKERAQHLNKIESQAELQRPPNPENTLPTRRKDKQHASADGDDDSQCGYVSLGAKEREWLLTCCSADYHPMAKLITHNTGLVKIRDITNTALHWAAKHGKPEVVKMIAGSKAVNMNQRSGYTPLHLAAMQGHEAIIDLLVSTYKADPNIRDYAGKKAKHYLRNSASTKAQQLLLSRRQPTITTSISESFLRSASFRKSRSKALSSLMSAQFGIKAQPIVRNSWEGAWEGGDGEVFESRTTPPNSSRPSPQVRRKGSLQLSGDSRLMPPPSGPAPSRLKKSRSGSRETSPGDKQFTRSGSDPNLRSPTSKSTVI